MRPAESRPAPPLATLACKRKTREELCNDTALINSLKGAIKNGSAKDGWVNLSAIGSQLVKAGRAFDHKQYSYSKLIGLIEATGLFESTSNGKGVLIRYDEPKNESNAVTPK